MNYPVVLLCIMLQLCNSWPVPVDKVKNEAKLLAQTTIIRIEKHTDQFKVSPNVVFSGLELIPDSSSDKALDSLGSVEENLGIFQEILSSLPVDNVDQILADIINLQTIIRSLAVSISCTPLKSRNTGHLENFLKNNSTFRFTIGNVALDRLQKYLLKLIRNLDQLKKC
ncbi:UNVERIFIED_CONTAM: hypothetical protein FKN15_048140 [Acipenser sinensis]